MSRTELLFPKLCMARAKATCCDFIRKPDQGTTKLDYCHCYYNSKNSYYFYCPRIEIIRVMLNEGGAGIHMVISAAA